jgi:hypothetical protein
MRFNPRPFLLFTFLFAILHAAGCSREKPIGPNWPPDPALLDQLDSFKDVGAYQIRAPKGYAELPDWPAPAGSKAYGWAGAQRPDGTAPSVTAMLVTPPAGQADSTTLEVFLQEARAGVKRRRVDWTQTAAEGGQISGMNFLRARWTGTEPNKKWKMHGFIYVARDKSTFIQLSSQDVEPNHDSALKLAEASILTFKKK